MESQKYRFTASMFPRQQTSHQPPSRRLLLLAETICRLSHREDTPAYLTLRAEGVKQYRQTQKERCNGVSRGITVSFTKRGRSHSVCVSDGKGRRPRMLEHSISWLQKLVLVLVNVEYQSSVCPSLPLATDLGRDDHGGTLDSDRSSQSSGITCKAAGDLGGVSIRLYGAHSGARGIECSRCLGCNLIFPGNSLGSPSRSLPTLFKT